MDKVDFLHTVDTDGYNVFKAVSARAKVIQKRKASVVYKGWFIQGNFMDLYKQYTFKTVSNDGLKRN